MKKEGSESRLTVPAGWRRTDERASTRGWPARCERTSKPLRFDNMRIYMLTLGQQAVCKRQLKGGAVPFIPVEGQRQERGWPPHHPTLRLSENPKRNKPSEDKARANVSEVEGRKSALATTLSAQERKIAPTTAQDKRPRCQPARCWGRSLIPPAELSAAPDSSASSMLTAFIDIPGRTVWRVRTRRLRRC